jgi:chemotaxis-related protein WspB
VLPLVQVTVIPRAPTEVAGIFSYRGRPVPLIDLRRLNLRRPARPKFSTRIIIVNDHGPDQGERLLGILAERVTEITRRAPEEFVDTGFINPATPYLGGVVTTPGGLVQRLDVHQLLPPATREMLFARPHGVRAEDAVAGEAEPR